MVTAFRHRFVVNDRVIGYVDPKPEGKRDCAHQFGGVT